MLKGQTKKSQKQVNPDLQEELRTLDDYPPYLAEIARYRLEAILPLLSLEPKARTSSAVEARAAELKASRIPASEDAYLGSVGRSSLYNWWHLSRAAQPGMLVMMDRGIVAAAGLRALVHQQQANAVARLKAHPFPHASQALSDGRSVVTLHPAGLPDVHLRVIEDRLEPHTADPRQRHRQVPTTLDPPNAPAVELILCSHERWAIDACIDAHNTSLRVSGQPLCRKDPALVRQERCGLLVVRSLVRWWMHQSACEAELDPDRLRFMHAVEVVDTACSAYALVPRAEFPRRQKRLLTDLREPSTVLEHSSYGHGIAHEYLL